MSQVRVELAPSVARQLAELGRASRARESGGVLLGTLPHPEVRRVERLASMPNERAGRRCYSAKPGRVWDELTRRRSDGQRPLGFFHTHPDLGSPWPSALDSRASAEGWIYAIVGGDGALGVFERPPRGRGLRPVPIANESRHVPRANTAVRTVVR